MLDQNSPSTRDRLLDAAFSAFYRGGFRATGIEQVLSAAGVTRGALYHYFANKRELGYAVIEERLAPGMMQVWVHPLEQEDKPLEALISTLQRAFEGVSDEQIERGCPLGNLALEMSAEDAGFCRRIEGLFETWFRAFERALVRAAEVGELREDVDPAAAARFILATIEGCRVLAKNARSREIMDGCLKGLIDYIERLKS